MAPGSNRWPDFTRRPEPAEMTTAEMKPGSGMIYIGRTIHGAGGNVAESSERAQQLLGWRCSSAGGQDFTRLWTVDYEDVPRGLGLLECVSRAGLT